MTAAPLTYTCVDCGDVFPYVLRGAAPKRCHDCKWGVDGERRRRGVRTSLEPGPILLVRSALQGANPELRMRAAAAGMAVAVGMNDDMAEAIVSAIDVLIAQGATPLEVRVRLNPDPALVGRKAPVDRVQLAWAELLHEVDDEEEGAA